METARARKPFSPRAMEMAADSPRFWADSGEEKEIKVPQIVHSDSWMSKVYSE